MNRVIIFILKGVRKLYSRFNRNTSLSKPNCEEDPEVASAIILEKLLNDEPCMIARFGNNELMALTSFLGITAKTKDYLGYITGEKLPWWCDEYIIHQMNECAGFFPPTEEKLMEFGQLMLNDIKEVNLLGSWLSLESHVLPRMNCELIHLRLLEPFWSKQPWTIALKGKKILVIHPFAETIVKQYEKRELLFDDQDLLPEFKSLQVIKAVQSIGGGNTQFKDWFEALDSMKHQIDNSDFDVCLIGAGAYGLPLAAHVKRIGKMGVHMGGALQLLFGIRGKRWEDPQYGVKEWGIPEGSYSNMMNKHWVRPIIDEKPKNASKVEGACYW
ncbi:hypothetical protein SAMN05216480_101545 [Pustulibacterium marinum]|uniref:Uncharacterized protein n=1 Tax=Pustulibacterium marinum TaxID=1224947 RepID=A0A1I7F1T5_9FLAO|nr:hypothetical protein [Pustulibacterium marinum]SFU30138.1 hypothetical protein SAMN05216480_101545 [Pustulibacterium marinum]